MMISRVAENCFWFGRYLERAESTARGLTTTRELALGAELSNSRNWLPVIIVAGEEERFSEVVGLEHAEDGDRVQRYMTWDEENPSSIHASVRALRDNARSIRDQISLEVWQTINSLHLWMQSDEGRRDYEDDRWAFYERLGATTERVHGLLANTMLRATALDFIRLGVMLERAGQTARILDVHHHANTLVQAHEVIDTAVWLSLLKAIGGYETFMKRNRGRASGERVVAFLVLEPAFPRSVLFAVRKAHESLMEIHPVDDDHPPLQAQNRLGELLAWLRGHDVPSFFQLGVHDGLTQVVDSVHEVCVEVGRELLGHVPVQPPVQSQAQG